MKIYFHALIFVIFRISILALIIFFLTIKEGFSQNNNLTQITFFPVYKSQPLQLPEQSDTFNLNTLKFYISKIEFLFNDKIVYTEENSFHLLDASIPESMKIATHLSKATQYNTIRFQLGIDSITNTAGAMGGDLDPTKGMYWTWQSGYINFKIEGTISISTARNHEFQFHLGGYLAPYNSVQVVTLNTKEGVPLSIYFDVDQFFSRIDLAKQNHIMSPGEDAVELSKHAASCFYLKQP